MFLDVLVVRPGAPIVASDRSYPDAQPLVRIERRTKAKKHDQPLG